MAGVEFVETAQKQLDAAVQRIHRDIDLTAEARNRMVEDVYSKARDEVFQEFQAEREKLELDMREARRLAFAPPILEVSEGRKPDPALVAKWYYEEIEKLKEIREPAKLEEVLQEALLLNNLPLAKAVLVRGYQLGNSMLVGRCFESFPDERGYWDNFIEKAEAYNAHEKSMSMFGAASRLRPLEHYLA